MNIKFLTMLLTCLIIFVSLNLTHVSGISEPRPLTSLISCPSEVEVGTSEVVSYLVQNNGSLPVTLDFGISNTDGEANIVSLTKNSSLEHSQIILKPSEAIIVKDSFSPKTLGIQRINVIVFYKFNESNVSYVKDICSVKVTPSLSVIDQSSSLFQTYFLSPIIIPSIATLVGYLLTNNYMNKKYVNEKQIDHTKWLQEQMHGNATVYYMPLVKFIYNFSTSLKLAISSKEDNLIYKSFIDLSNFLKKYIELEEKLGANYIFLNQDVEKIAAWLNVSILNRLPFDRQEIYSINKKKSRAALFRYYTAWVKSDYCSLSKERLMELLSDFSKILQQESEFILSPEKNQNPSTNYLENTKYVKRRQSEKLPFNVILISPKVIKPGNEVELLGSNFDEQLIKNYNLRFCISHKILYVSKVDYLILEITIDNLRETVKLKIPNNIGYGTYDIFLRFSPLYDPDLRLPQRSEEAFPIHIEK